MDSVARKEASTERIICYEKEIIDDIAHVSLQRSSMEKGMILYTHCASPPIVKEKREKKE